MKALVALVCAFLFVGSGCARRPPLKLSVLHSIQEGEAKRTEVEKLLGSPDEAVTGANHKTLTLYGDHRTTRRLHFFKDVYDHFFLSAQFLYQSDGVLEKKLISETQTTTTIKFGVFTIGEAVTDEQIAKLIPHITRLDEVIGILGRPITEQLTLEGSIVRKWVFGRQGFLSSMKMQVINAVFDAEREVMVDFSISDDVPANQKKKAREPETQFA